MVLTFGLSLRRTRLVERVFDLRIDLRLVLTVGLDPMVGVDPTVGLPCAITEAVFIASRAVLPVLSTTVIAVFNPDPIEASCILIITSLTPVSLGPVSLTLSGCVPSLPGADGTGEAGGSNGSDGADGSNG